MDGRETHTSKADEGCAHRSRQVRCGAASSDPIHQATTVRYPKAAFGLAGNESYVDARDYDALATQFADLEQSYEECVQERDNLKAILNTPETEDFFKGIKLEAAHQRLRWPAEHDAGKTYADWYLAGKCLHAAHCRRFRESTPPHDQHRGCTRQLASGH